MVKRNTNRVSIFMVNFCNLFPAIFILVTLQTACKKLVEVPPPENLIVQSNVYADNASAIAAVTGIYTNITQVAFTRSFTGNQSISLLAGLSADELTLYNGVTNFVHIGYFTNSLLANPPVRAAGSEHWTELYKFIFKCNAVLEGLESEAANALNLVIKKQLLGEAKFLRGFFYFYLVNLYGDAPLALTSDYKVNSLLSRTPIAEVYQQIIADLSEAEKLLSENYLRPDLLTEGPERVRPTKWAATALLSRVYLYTRNYVDAEEKASDVINNTGLYSLVPLNEVFLKNSNEAIWQLQPTTLYFNTQDATTFIIPPAGLTDGEDATNPVFISSNLLNSFEAADNRAVIGNWINAILIDTITYYFPFKYKNGGEDLSITSSDAMIEYLMILRLGEQYLIRAEARAQQNNIAGAETDLNEIRSRAGLPETSANDRNSLLDAIAHERQVELFTEWGHRWLDLKRTGNINDVMKMVTPLKANGKAWISSQQLYPLPVSDLQKAPNLAQNAGY